MSSRWDICAGKVIVAAIAGEEIKRAEILAMMCSDLDKARIPTTHFHEKAQEASRMLAEIPGTPGRPVSKKTMERVWYKWRVRKRWEDLVDQRVWGLHNKDLPTTQRDFLLHISKLCDAYTTKKQAVEELLRQWRDGESVPGYEGQNNGKNLPYPKGWSFDNLMKIMPPKRLTARAFAKQENIPTLEERRTALNEVLNIIYELVEERIASKTAGTTSESEQ